MSKRYLLIGLAVCLGTSGCTSFEMSRLRNRIDRDVPSAEIGEGFALAFGRITMGTARTALAIGDDGSDPSVKAVRAMLRHVKKVQIGRYEVEGALDQAQVSSLRVFEAYRRDGWEPVVTVRDEEAVWIMVREKRETLRDMLVVVLSDEELVLAKMSGNLSGAVTAALSEADWTRDLARSLRSPLDAPGDSARAATPDPADESDTG